MAAWQSEMMYTFAFSIRKMKVLHETGGKENAGELTLEGRAGPTCQPMPALDATVVQLGMNAAANISFGG